MIILTDKPGGLTSHNLISKIKKASPSDIKIGHTGTLDPMCTGVLPVLTGKYTKLSEFFPSDKKYNALIKFGIKTDTQDITGNVISRSNAKVTIDELEQTTRKFIGNIIQTPPMYSAVKVGGVRLYKLARKGIEVERNPREITVYNIECAPASTENEFELIISCSSGTYIRTLCNDIGDSLKCGAVMSALRRIESNGFTIDRCNSLDTVLEHTKNGTLDIISISCDEAFGDCCKVVIPADGEKYYLNGGKIQKGRIKCCSDIKSKTKSEEKILLRVFNEKDLFLGLGEYINGFIKSVWNEF